MTARRTPSPMSPVRQPRLPARTRLVMACSLLLAGPTLAQTVPAVATANSSTADAASADAAATAPAGGSLQVTVTARKRKETMLEVPISVQSMSERELRAAGITDIKELASQTGFNFTSAQGSGAQGRASGVTTFRGLQGELNLPWENSGGVFIDGIFISGGVASIDMSDVSRVEVLKGPQNAFFGRSTFGGAVNFITKKPSDSFSGSVSTSVNERGSTDTSAALEGPLVEGLLSGRLSVGSRNKTALYHATDGGDLGAEKTTFIGGTLLLTPTDALWVRLRGHYQRDEDSQPASAYIAAGSNTSCDGKRYTGKGRDGQTVSFTPGTPYFCGTIPSYKDVGSSTIDANTAIPSGAYAALVNNSLNDPFLAKSPKLNHTGMLRETTRLATQLGLSLPMDMDMAMNLGYNKSAVTSIYDLDRTKTNNFISLQSNPTEDLTFDTRLASDPNASLRGVVGVSYFSSTYQLTQIDYSMAFYSDPDDTVASRSSSAYLNLHSTVPAAYASVEYDLTRQWTVSAESRYQVDKVASTAFTGTRAEHTVKNWLPRLTLRYKPDATLSAYVNLARGVQPLTVNTGYLNASEAGKAYINTLYPSASTFTPQPKLDSMELGVKQQLSDWVQYAVAVYDQRWKNRLSGSSVFNPEACGISVGNTDECPLAATGAGITIGNEARVRGIELTLDAQFSPAWSGGAYIDYKNAKWVRFDSSSTSSYSSYRSNALTGTAVSFGGNEMSRVPKITLAANTTYRYGLTENWTAYTRGDLSYTGKRWIDDYNIASVNGFSQVDLRQGFETKHYSIELFAKNLFDSRGWVTASRSVNLGLSPLTSYSKQGILATVQEGRTLGVRLRYSF